MKTNLLIDLLMYLTILWCGFVMGETFGCDYFQLSINQDHEKGISLKDLK